MKVVIAPDSFKNAIRADRAAAHLAAGLRSILPEVKTDLCPVSDGGEGFSEVFRVYPLVQFRTTPTTDPLGRPINACWGIIPNKPPTNFYELASASGLESVPQAERNPLKTTTFGTGALIEKTQRGGIGLIMLGIGGSATNDAGCGIAQALGVRFGDREGRRIDKPITGADLASIATIETTIDSQAFGLSMKVACDVDNPLTGPNGAAQVYGPQKGATPEQVEQLDAGLRHIAELWREQLGVDVEHLPGAGAAGGVGGGLVAMLGAELVPGAEVVLDTIHFDDRIKDADLVITGEGRLDAQSLNGKAVMAVAKRAKAAGVPCVALVGGVGDGAERMFDHGLSDIVVIGEGIDPDESIRRTGELLEHAAARLARERLN